QQRAWTWETQALVRARPLAGAPELCEAFAALRCKILSHARSEETLRDDVSSMRRRMRAELDRSDAARFDLKQGDGGLVDLEFLLQYLVLRDATCHPALLKPRATPALLDALVDAGTLAANAGETLRGAHAVLLD